MSVIFGSARINEQGTINGGAKGDQTGQEVSTQPFYLHAKGWIILRAKSASVAEKQAYAMRAMCANDCFGYGQHDRNTAWEALSAVDFDPAKVTTQCNIDCSLAVRACMRYAGIETPAFNTTSEVGVVMATGHYRQIDFYDGAELYVGDILVTKGKGHTVIVIEGKEVAPVPLNPTKCAKNVMSGQKWINDHYASKLTKYMGRILTVDGIYGRNTRNGCVVVWKDLCNRKYKTTLTPNNYNFLNSCKEAAKQFVTLREGDKGTFTYIVQLILAACNMYEDSMDAKFGAVTADGVKRFQKKYELEVDGIVGPETWHALFNKAPLK